MHTVSSEVGEGGIKINCIYIEQIDVRVRPVVQSISGFCPIVVVG